MKCRSHILTGNFSAPPPCLSTRPLSYCICVQVTSSGVGPILNGRSDSFFFSFCFLSSTHRREVKRKEEEPPFFFKWNVGLLESDSLRGHSIKGLKQSNQHTFFNHLQSYKSFIITEYNKLIISSLSTVGNIQPWSCRIFFSFLFFWYEIPSPPLLFPVCSDYVKNKKKTTHNCRIG